MRRNLLILTWLLVASLLFSAQGWAVCPEDPNDTGECDTLHVDIFPGDQEPSGGYQPYLVRFPVRVTHDIVDPSIDSLAAFVIPLCYEHSNPGTYCSLSTYWNNTNLWPQPNLDRSIFRHLEGETNWMMWLSEQSAIIPWDYIMLDLDGTSHFWLAMVPTGSADQRFPDGSRILLFTMTFKAYDSTTICIDSCFWPPSDRLAFSRSDAVTFIPRHHLPVCEKVGLFPGLPVFVVCPSGEIHFHNGSGFSSSGFVVETFPFGGEISSVSAEFTGSGVENVGVVYTVPPPSDHVEGFVTYDVADHCEPGGTIDLTALDDVGAPGYCDFFIELASSPPWLSLPDTFLAIAGNYTMGMIVSATDPEADPLTIGLEAFWYEEDSLQQPVNPPYLEGDNPRFFRWAPTDTDTGTWIGLFSATDTCGAADSGLVTILVGPLFCGDNTGDGLVDLGDAVFLLGHLFKQQPPPDPPCKSDINCDGVTDVGDVVRMLNYLFRFGTAPCFDCCVRGF